MKNTNLQRVLVVDTEADDLGPLREAFKTVCGRDAVIATVRSARALAVELGRRPGYEVVVLDYLLGDGHQSGPDLLRGLREQDPLVPVVAVAGRGDVDTAMAAIHDGASDFLVRGDRLPERVEILIRKIRKTLGLIEQNRTLDWRTRELQLREEERDRMIGDSPLMQALTAQIDQVASIPRPVLIVGERGTGKELVARAIHRQGLGPARPFVVVNCAAFSDALLESELFGHERGAYTGAESAAPGRFEQAHGGTLFLDELGNMGLGFQRKILRAVEYGTFTRVGGTREIRSSARIVAATNADLQALIREGRFLPDLYDRLAFEVIRVPPLRERPEDVWRLAEHFISRFGAEIPAFRGKRLSDAALQLLRRHRFPGNIRELKNLIERALYRDTTNQLTPEDLGLLPVPPQEQEALQGGFKAQVAAFERRLIEEALRAEGGNQAAAARRLELSYHQFRHYLRKHRGEG